MARTGTTSKPSIATFFSPQITGSTAPSDSSALNGSKRPGRGSRDSGSSRGARTTSATITGALTRKTTPQWKCSSSTPLSSGPSAAPPETPADQIATALRRSSGSWKTLRISASVDGISVAPPTPISARAAISISALVENAASTDAAPNAAAPIVRRRRRPMRSPSDPIVTSSPASTNE